MINVQEKHFCPVCGKECKRIFCSKECRYSEKGLKLIQEKMAKTNLERYGFITPSKNKNVKEKAKRTCLERYGCVSTAQTDIVKEKYKQTCIKRYGVECTFKNKEIKKKALNTCKEHYGVENPFSSVEIKKQLTLRKLKKTFNQMLLSENFIPLFTIDEWIENNGGSTGDHTYKFKCKRCNEIFMRKLHNGFSSCRCPKCDMAVDSNAEQEVADWLYSIGVENIERNRRTWNGISSSYQVEADIYLPNYKLAIEYNGIYWHSCINKDKNYHFNKWKFFKDQNIECIQIFENEWRDKPDVVKGIILNKLGKCKKIYARKCIIKEISNDEYRKFLNENHLQGYCSAKVRLGLYFENELVELMSFSKSRFNKKYDWENIRTCTKVGHHVIGGFSKLISHFKNNYSGSIISYIDSRYFNGKGYMKNNFQNIGHSSPNYFYFRLKEFVLYSRNLFQKFKLKNKLEKFDEKLSEQENMANNLWFHIYDCGNDVLVCE